MILKETGIPIFVVLPLSGAFLISIVKNKIPRFGDILSGLAALISLILSFMYLAAVNKQGVLIFNVGAWRPPIGISMVLDGFSIFMLVVINLASFIISLYSIDYMEKYTAKWKYYTLFLLLIAGLNGAVITGDIFNLFVFLEISSVASYALVAFGTQKNELEAAFKYAVMGTVGSIFILLGIAFLYSYTSTLNLADMAAILTQKNASNIMLLVNVLFIMGFGLKCALVPFHAWLPDAHTSAPAPISAILSGVLIKSLGVYALIRIFFNVFGMTPVIQAQLMFLGALSMVAGGILSVSQWDFKRLLAYSSISQIGYIILGISLGTPLGILGGLFHLVNHSIFKPLLFLNAGAVEYATGTRDLNKMGGLASRMPLTRFTNLIGSSSISGIPPFNGFWSKLIIVIACVEAGRIGYALCAVLASILTLSAVIKAMKYAFYGRLKETLSQVKEVPFFMRLSMSILAAVCIVAGILLLPNLYEFFLKPAQTVLLSGVEYRNLILK